MLRSHWPLLVALWSVTLSAKANAADEAKALKEHVLANYTKCEYKIPMRDGVKLFTVVYAPKDTQKTYPMLMHRTPYGVGPYGVDNYGDRLSTAALYLKSGYILVNQDVRGRMNSEGSFIDMRPHQPAKTKPAEVDESSDTFDTIEWLLKKVPGHNGKVGLLGISYPGFYAACGMIDAHPALKAVSPQAPVMDMFDGDDWRHNGALLLTHNFGFEQVFNKMTPKLYRKPGSTEFDYGTPDGYQFYLDMGPLANADIKHFKGSSPFWNEAMKHGNYDDFCKSRDLRPHVKNIKPAVLTVGGWYDAEDLAGTLHCYRRVAASSPDCPQNVLVMGPWVHGGWSRGDGDALGPEVQRQDERVLSQGCRVPVLREPSERGESRGAAEGRADVRDRHEPLAALRHLAPEGSREGEAAFRGRSNAGVDQEQGGGFRRVRIRPCQARAVCGENCRPHGQ